MIKINYTENKRERENTSLGNNLTVVCVCLSPSELSDKQVKGT